MRKPEGDNPYYNIDKDYIRTEVEYYLFHVNNLCPEWSGLTRVGSGRTSEELKEEKTEISDNPKDYEYGGFWYKKGKISQSRLINFYKKFGFIEDPSLYFDWKCYDEYPYPTMRLNMNGMIHPIIKKVTTTRLILSKV